VQWAKATGRQRISGSTGRLDAVTKGAQGASAEAADEVKEW
jgi:conjugal transfer mating pair stabilization protein TraG